MKVSLIVKASGSGAEVVPYLKIGAVLPGAFFLTYLFTKLINRFDREHVFYAMLSVFLGYFTLFIFVLYPNSEALELNGVANFLESYLLVPPSFKKGLISIIRHWNLSLFYVLCEMWSAVVLSMLFWGFANEVTKVHEAKRFYAIFALGANFSGMISGQFGVWVQSVPYNPHLPLDAETQWVYLQMITVLAIGLVIVALFYWLNRSIFHIENVRSLQIPKRSEKVSLSECFSYLRKSKYVTYILILVVAYNIVYNLVDVMWTARVEQLYENSKDVNAYMHQITYVTGFVAIVFAFIVSGNALRHYGWTIAALITPIIWFITTIGFFGSQLFEMQFTDVFSHFVTNPANLILLFGSIQICLGRACKYTVFDETKEIAFIPLPKENQRKGKAVVDGLASRFGKSGGSVIYLVLFTMLDGISATIPYITAIILIMMVLWFIAVRGLGKMVNETIDHEHGSVVDESGLHMDKPAELGANTAQATG